MLERTCWDLIGNKDRCRHDRRRLVPFLKSFLQVMYVHCGILAHTMGIEQSAERPLTINRPSAWSLRRLLHLFRFAVNIMLAIFLLGRSNVDAVGSTWLALH